MLQQTQIWRQGFPNENMNSYFNTFIQMYINCLDILPWKETSNSKFNNNVKLLKNENPNKFQELMKNLNQSLVYQDQNSNQGNDPIKVLSEVIQNTLQNQPKFTLQFLPGKYLEIYKRYSKDNSETSFLFQSIFYEGSECNNCCINQPLKENQFYFVTLNTKLGAEQGSQEFVQSLMDQLCSKKQDLSKCNQCQMQLKNVCGFIKLPKFLYIDLHQELPEDIEIDKEIKVFNVAEDNFVTYSLEGIINHPPAHYTYCRRVQESSEWISYDDDYVSDISKPRFPKGLLYVATQNQDDNIKTIEVEPFSKFKISDDQSKVNLKANTLVIHQRNQDLLKRLNEIHYEELKVEEQNQNRILISGKSKKSITLMQDVIIKVLSIQQDADISQYSQIFESIKQIQSKKIILNINAHHFSSHNQYAIVNEVDNLTNLEQELSNSLKDADYKIAFFVEFLEFLLEIEQKGINCSPLQLKDIWINSDNEWKILALHLYEDKESSLDVTLFWIRCLLSQLFPCGTQSISSFNEILSFLSFKSGQEKIEFEKIIKNIKNISDKQKEDSSLSFKKNIEDLSSQSKEKSKKENSNIQSQSQMKSKLLLNDDVEKKSKIQKEIEVHDSLNPVDSQAITQNLLGNYSSEYSDITIVEQNQYYTLMKGKDRTKKSVIITDFKIASEEDIDRYSDIQDNLISYQYPDIIQHTHGYINKETNKFLIFNTMEQSNNLSEYITMNPVNYLERQEIFKSIIKLLNKAQSIGLSCQSVQLEEIYLNKINMPSIPSLFFFLEQNTENSINWLQTIINKMFDINSMQNIYHKLTISSILTYLKTDSQKSLKDILQFMLNTLENNNSSPHKRY